MESLLSCKQKKYFYINLGQILYLGIEIWCFFFNLLRLISLHRKQAAIYIQCICVHTVHVQNCLYWTRISVVICWHYCYSAISELVFSGGYTAPAAMDKTKQVLFTINTYYLSSCMHWLECMQLEMWIPLLSCNLYMFDPLLCSFCLIVIKLHTIPKVLKRLRMSWSLDPYPVCSNWGLSLFPTHAISFFISTHPYCCLSLSQSPPTHF